MLSLLIVNAYGAAVFGRLRSLPMTFVGAIVLGCLDGYLAGYLPSSGTVGPFVAGLRLASPVILLFIVLLVLPNRRLRSHVRAREFFPAPTTKGLVLFSLLTLGFGLVLATTLSKPDLLTYGKMFSIGIVALSLVPLVGFAGQISLCQLSFAGIGALVMAHLGAGGNPLGLVAAVVICAAVGGLVALPRSSAAVVGGSTWPWPPPPSPCCSIDGSSCCPTGAGDRCTSASSPRAPWRCPR